MSTLAETKSKAMRGLADEVARLEAENAKLREALERVEKNTRMGPLLTDGTIQAVRNALGQRDPKQSGEATKEDK